MASVKSSGIRPLRIAIWHNLPSGGGKRQLYNHVQGLLKRGHHLESWCPDTADQKYLPLGSLIKEHVVPLRGPTHLFPHPNRPLRATRDLVESMEEHCRACAVEIGRSDFDVLFANACMFLRSSPVAGHLTLPSALFLHEPYRWFYEAMPELPWLAPHRSPEKTFSVRALARSVAARSALDSIRLQARAELEFVKRYDFVLANSIFSRETLLRTYNIESTVCYLGVDCDVYKPTGEPKENLVVGLGTIYHAKGVDRAIRAVATLPAGTRPSLVWIGNGAWPDDLAEYERLAHRLGVAFDAKLHLTDSEVISLLSRAKALIYTSRLEPFGFAPLEANACGTPAVGICEGGIKETIEEGVNGWLVREDDPQTLGERLTPLLNDPELASRMGAQARRYVQATWNLEKGTDAIEAILLRLRDMHRAKTLLSQPTARHKLEPTNNIRFHIDQRRVKNRTLRVSGWAYIDDGLSAEGSQIFLLVRNSFDAQLFPVTPVRRRDVTQHFGNLVDLDHAGFTVEGKITLDVPYDLGIVIARAGDLALQMVQQ